MKRWLSICILFIAMICFTIPTYADEHKCKYCENTVNYTDVCSSCVASGRSKLQANDNKLLFEIVENYDIYTDVVKTLNLVGVSVNDLRSGEKLYSNGNRFSARYTLNFNPYGYIDVNVYNKKVRDIYYNNQALFEYDVVYNKITDVYIEPSVKQRLYEESHITLIYGLEKLYGRIDQSSVIIGDSVHYSKDADGYYISGVVRYKTNSGEKRDNFSIQMTIKSAKVVNIGFMSIGSTIIIR